jgi:2-C-methyl-D-erythritol 2,4-cyclodiphosphate synthase/2-C-methyl-D-erythritol 4-phosphate cytidylyltransferase
MSKKPFPEKCHVLIPSAGTGSRLGGDLPKQYQVLAGKMVIVHSLDIFSELQEIETIWLGVSPQSDFLSFQDYPKAQVLHSGGATRAQTVLNTLGAMLEQLPATDWVLVHDAARPGLKKDDVLRLINDVTADSQHCGGILAIPLADTLKKVDSLKNPHIEQTLSRNELWLAQTPQMFRIGELHRALKKAFEKNLPITDEASAMESEGYAPILVQGSSDNFKITYPQDFSMMEKILPSTPIIRIGQGYDVHRLVDGRDLILGGIHVPYAKGLLGHSDADALLHAITDALLGAAGLGDIGKHFPDTDPQYKNADSAKLLKYTHELLKSKGFEVINIDSTIICQEPKLSQHIPSMMASISQLLGIHEACLNIKAKTNEGLGYLGQSEAIEAQAIVLVQCYQ